MEKAGSSLTLARGGLGAAAPRLVTLPEGGFALRRIHYNI